MLRFRLFDIPVVVRPSFLLIAAIIGFSWASQPSRALIWIGVIFVSILIHELGHALTARGFGSEVAIELNAVGRAGHVGNRVQSRKRDAGRR